MHIAKYPYATLFNHPPRRERKLLMKMRELKRLSGKIKEQGYTLIPLSLYFKNGWAKVELALAKGRKKYDKRAKIQKRELERELQYK
jgi:SsrA-binding protein